MKRIFFIFFSFLLASTYTHALEANKSSQATINTNSFAKLKLEQEIKTLIKPYQYHAMVSVYVKSMRYGDSLFNQNIYIPLTPASTLKVLTAEAALLFLGPEYRFSTQLLTDATEVKQGVLKGNLYVVLSGDPTLTYKDLTELMIILNEHEIKTISGNVYIDNSAYDQNSFGPGWDWKDKGYCYAAPISASIINHNCLSFKITPAQKNGQIAEVITPSSFFIPSIKNTVITKPKSSHCGIHMKTEHNIISIDGCLPKGNSWGISYVVNDVQNYELAMVQRLLVKSKIKTLGRIVIGSSKESLSMLGQHASKPLKELIVEMLKKSDNIIAGALFKKIGQLYTKSQGSWEKGSLAVTNILKKHAGCNFSSSKILDGSGLSPHNLITTFSMMQVLSQAFHNNTQDTFITALPIAGVDGTLKHRLSHLMYRVKAKTGTLTGVVSLAGYAYTKDEEPLAFVIIINGSKYSSYQYKNLEDDIVTLIARFKRN